MPSLSVIVPVFNESSTIAHVVARIFAATLPPGWQREIIVVDDGSNDATPDALSALGVQSGLLVVHHGKNRGKGAALRSGLARATGEAVIFQDADLEYDPEDYAVLLAPLLRGEADVVYGSRFLPASRTSISPLFRTANRILTSLSNRTTGLQLTDMETGFKLFTRSMAKRLSITEDGFSVEPEITAQIARWANRGECRIAEVPIRYCARGYHNGKKIGVSDGLETLAAIIRYRRRS